VQRYLSAKSVDEARSSLLMSAYWKIPLQAMVLLVGVLVFLFFLFEPAPMLYNPSHAARVQSAEPAAYAALQSRYANAISLRTAAARAVSDARRSGNTDAARASLEQFRASDKSVTAVRNDALGAVTRVTGQPSRDVNYIIPRFVIGYLPLGLAGLFIAAVLGAAMSAISAELSSLSTATVIDFYRRWYKPEASDEHFLNVSRVATAGWGVFACIVASYAATLGSLIEVVNRFGSFFYGSILGVFLLAMIPRTSARGAFVGLLAGMSAVAAVSFGAPSVSFLWHNVIGAVTVLAVGTLLSVGTPAPQTQRSA
jgi:Na+/proline symporter